MTKLVGYRWKDVFQDNEWHQQNPAEKYLSWESKAQMLELLVLGEEDWDSEAEVYIFDYDNTN